MPCHIQKYRTPFFSIRPVIVPVAVLICVLGGMIIFPPVAHAVDRQTVVWSCDIEAAGRFEQTCRACDVLSGDVLWANGYASGTLPPDGELLLLPASKNDLVPTWIEVQNRKTGNSGTIVTVKLHGVPASARKTQQAENASVSPQASKDHAPTSPTPKPVLPVAQKAPAVKSADVTQTSPKSRDVVPALPDKPQPAPVTPISSDTRVKKLPVFPADEPLVTVKLHGRPAFLRDRVPDTVPTGGSSPVSADTQQHPVASARPASPDLIPSNVSADRPNASEDRPAATTEMRRDSTKNIRLVVSGDEVIVLAASGEGVKKETPPSENTALAPVVLPPLTLPPLKPPVQTPFVASGKMMWPVTGKVSSGFGKRGKRRMHAGLDLPMPKGTPIAAALDGVVLETCTTQTRKYRGYGNAVLINHGNGIVTMYAHCSSVSVKAGQNIRQGEIVGLVGNTGRTTTHHVHFEVRKNGKAVDPIPYMTPR